MDRFSRPSHMLQKFGTNKDFARKCAKMSTNKVAHLKLMGPADYLLLLIFGNRSIVSFSVIWKKMFIYILTCSLFGVKMITKGDDVKDQSNNIAKNNSDAYTRF